MAKAKRAPESESAPSGDVSLAIDGKTYLLRLTIGALAEARRALRQQGIVINLLMSLSLDDMDADTLPGLLFGALRVHHPSVTFSQAKQMVRFDTYGIVFSAIVAAYSAAMRGQEGKPSDGNPQPQA
jgi:hypothetical protein